MANTKFEDILSKAPSDVKPPTVLPPGEYLCVVQGMPRRDKSAKKETPYLEYALVVQQALDSALEAGADAVEGGVVGKVIKATYYLTDNSLFMLKEFFENCGLDVDAAETLQELVDQPNGSQVIATIRHEASDDGKRTFAKLAGTAPVSEE